MSLEAIANDLQGDNMEYTSSQFVGHMVEFLEREVLHFGGFTYIHKRETIFASFEWLTQSSPLLCHHFVQGMVVFEYIEAITETQMFVVNFEGVNLNTNVLESVYLIDGITVEGSNEYNRVRISHPSPCRPNGVGPSRAPPHPILQ